MKIQENINKFLQRLKSTALYLRGVKLPSLLGGAGGRLPIKRMDWYIINKFIGTYVYSIVLIISISIVFDVNENLAKFTSNNAPLRAIVFDYYANFVPYFANLVSSDCCAPTSSQQHSSPCSTSTSARMSSPREQWCATTSSRSTRTTRRIRRHQTSS